MGVTGLPFHAHVSPPQFQSCFHQHFHCRDDDASRPGRDRARLFRRATKVQIAFGECVELH